MNESDLRAAHSFCQVRVGGGLIVALFCELKELQYVFGADIFVTSFYQLEHVSEWCLWTILYPDRETEKTVKTDTSILSSPLCGIDP